MISTSVQSLAGIVDPINAPTRARAAAAARAPPRDLSRPHVEETIAGHGHPDGQPARACHHRPYRRSRARLVAVFPVDADFLHLAMEMDILVPEISISRVMKS